MAESSTGVTISTFTKTLLVLTVITGLTSGIGSEIVDNPDSPEIQYSVEPSDRPCEIQSGSRDARNATDSQNSAAHISYTELSPEAQEIVRMTLQEEGTYTTRTAPDDITVQTDYPRPNYVRYNSECYKLTGQSTRSQDATFYAFVLGTYGGMLTGIFAVASVVSFLWTTVRQRSGDR
jgi:hypothetical protein